jgi:hypothetical protein
MSNVRPLTLPGAMFESTVALFDAYYRHLDAHAAEGFVRDLGSEVRERLEQLDYIVRRVRALELAANAARSRSLAAFRAHIEDVEARNVTYESEPLPPSASITREEFKIVQAAQFEMKLLTESFYYFAGRIRTILRNPMAPVPGLTSFECPGVRNTRNKLLEHAEGRDSQVSIQSFGWGAPIGPVIKALRYGGQENVFPDQGLYVNAEEFRENLERLLHATLPEA